MITFLALINNTVMLNLFQHPIIKVCDRQVCYMQIADQASVNVLWVPETSSGWHGGRGVRPSQSAVFV